MARHCLKIGTATIIGSAAIIGNSCAGFPIWEVPCSPGSVDDQACVTLDFPADVDGSLSLPEPVTVVF